jgi:hypothetical protein
LLSLDLGGLTLFAGSLPYIYSLIHLLQLL